MGMAGAAARFRAAAPQSEHAALDSTFFDRRRASSYFRQRAGRTIQTLKVTTLTDVESLAVLDVHIAGSVEARHEDGTAGRPPKRGRPAVGYRRQRLPRLAHRVRIAAHDIDYLVHYRGSSANAAAKTLSTGQKVTLSGGWPKHRIRQRSARSATPCERWAGIDSSVKSS